MASTYSNLKIQLMATGENNSTWGTVTNTNLGTAIEEAIVGSADVTFASGDVTLTLTNTNATQTARNLRLNLTGTTGGARNLVVPAIEKLYLINNGCADAVTVKNSTGSGVIVPAGKTMYVYNTGSNVVDAVTHLSSLTLASALPIASGGTGSTTATFSGANISSLNGSNVTSGTISNDRTTASTSNSANTIVARGASGEFSAGAITGASFSGDGSGLTALNASNVSTGTLAVARGGTGAATLTANNVILGNSTSAVQFVAPGTSGNVLTSNGTTWTSSAAFVTGMIMLWSGSIATIPSGWALCNGSNGTPDLRDRFIVGAGNTYAVNATGGSATTTLAEANLPSHTHSFSASATTGNQSADHNHTFSGTTSGQSQTHTHSATDSGHTHSVGAGATTDNVISQRYSDNPGNINSTGSQTTGTGTANISVGNASVDHTHTYSGTTSGVSANHNHSVSVSGTTGATGSGTSFTNLPPYYALAYIMKL